MALVLTAEDLQQSISSASPAICDEIQKICRNKMAASGRVQGDWTSLYDITRLYLAVELTGSPLLGYEDLPESVVAQLPEWMELSQNAGCRDLIARCYDLRWLAIRRSKQKGNFVDIARTAIDAYHGEAQDLDLRKHPLKSFVRFQRAIRLARTINDSANRQAIQESIKRVVAANASQETGVGCYRLISILKDERDTNSDAECGGWCASAMASCTQRGIATSDPNLHSQAAEYGLLRMHWIEQSDREQLDLAWSGVAECYERFAELYAQGAATNPIWNHTAAHWTEKAIEARRNGNAPTTTINELHRRLLQLQKESVKSMGVRPALSADTSDLAQDARTSIEKHDSFIPAIFELATFTSPPSADQVRETLKDKSVLESLLRIVRVSGDGKSIAGRDGIYEDDDSYWSATVEQMTKFHALMMKASIAPALLAFNGKFEILLHDLEMMTRLAYLVPAGRSETWARGIHAGFCHDWTLVAHLLPPQIEHSLRKLFESKGVITSNLKRERQHEFDLNKILALESARTVLGEDAQLDLAACLAHPLGSNVRNYMAHGLLADDDYQSIPVYYLWWIALRMILVPQVFSIPLNGDVSAFYESRGRKTDDSPQTAAAVGLDGTEGIPSSLPEEEHEGVTVTAEQRARREESACDLALPEADMTTKADAVPGLVE